MTPCEAARRWWPAGLRDEVRAPQGSLWDALVASAERQPAKAAFVLGDDVLTYGALVRAAEAVAGWLQRRAGVQRGDRVLLWSQNSLAFVIASYGVLRADAAVVPLNAMWTTEEVRHVADDSSARAAIVADEFAGRLAPLLGTTLLRQALSIGGASGSATTAWDEALAASLAPLPHRAGTDDLAVLPYTSGTTGRPKGCLHTHASVQSANLAAAAWRAQTADDVFLGIAPLFHALGMQNGMHLPAMLGATSVLLPRWNRDAALALIERHRVTCWAAPPAMLLDFFANPAVTPDRVASLRLVTGGSSPMPAALEAAMRERYGIVYQEGYGMTETASFLLGNPPQRPRRGSLGVPGPGVDCRIVDPASLQPLPAGEVGEIVVAGPQVMRGYWRAADDAAFVEIDGRAFLRTGDLGHADAEGYLFMTDRLKRMVTVSGYKVWPAEVEAVLLAHPAVHEVCVVARPDERSGEAVKALVVARPAAAADAAELIAWARQRMAVYKAPRFVEFVTALPKSNTGKVLWRELQERERA
jgi:acyl-CoA synthetase (AMP-forming)/AMP-acid ligase II